MKGLGYLIDLRRSGVTPPIVTLHLVEAGEQYPMGSKGCWLQADVEENLSKLDLRPLVGLKVVVHGPHLHQRTVRAACMAVIEAKPRGVIGVASDTPRIEARNTVFAWGDI